MQPWFFEEISRGLSTPRLEAYRQDGQNDFEVLCNYVWNQRLCESAYPALETLEVSLRNSIHAAISKRLGTPTWFDDGFLDVSERKSVQAAKDELTKSRKLHEPGRIIAELNFGFWTSLFASHYDRPLWHHLLRDVFPIFLWRCGLEAMSRIDSRKSANFEIGYSTTKEFFIHLIYWWCILKLCKQSHG